MTVAQLFQNLMTEIWESGGKVYDEFHDARKTLKHYDFPHKRLWSNKIGGESGYVYELDDGSRVWIATHGGAVRVVRKQGELA